MGEGEVEVKSVRVLSKVGQGVSTEKLTHKRPEATAGEQCPGRGIPGWGQNQCFHPEEVSVSKGIKESRANVISCTGGFRNCQ